MGALEELSTAVGGVAERVAPAVVSIGGGWRGGSGVVIGPGLVLTNAHNVHHDEVPVGFADGRQATATVAGVDADGDLAVVKVDTGGIAPLEWAADGAAAIGTPVLAVTGTPLGPRVTLGLVSSVARAFRGPRGRRISGSIEHTAPMARGSSGSALVDVQGRLVGIEHQPRRGRLLPGHPDRQRPSSPRGHAGPRRIGGAAAARHRGRARPCGATAPAGGGPARSRRAAGPRGRRRDAGGRSRDPSGDLLVEAGGRPLTGVDDLFDALGTVNGSGALQVKVVRGAEERSISVDFRASGAQAAAEADPETPVH